MGILRWTLHAGLFCQMENVDFKGNYKLSYKAKC